MKLIKNIFKYNNKCNICYKKCPLISFKCMCGGRFCKNRKYPYIFVIIIINLLNMICQKFI